MNISGVSRSHDTYRIRSVMDCLPDDGEEVLAYGNLTYCCELDMEPKKKWHKCCFKFCIGSYKIKKYTVALEESQIEDARVFEHWYVGPPPEYGAGEHLIGVTQWRKLSPEMSKEELARILDMVDMDAKR